MKHETQTRNLQPARLLVHSTRCHLGKQDRHELEYQCPPVWLLVHRTHCRLMAKHSNSPLDRSPELMMVDLVLGVRLAVLHPR